MTPEAAEELLRRVAVEEAAGCRGLAVALLTATPPPVEKGVVEATGLSLAWPHPRKTEPPAAAGAEVERSLEPAEGDAIEIDAERSFAPPPSARFHPRSTTCSSLG